MMEWKVKDIKKKKKPYYAWQEQGQPVPQTEFVSMLS